MGSMTESRLSVLLFGIFFGVLGISMFVTYRATIIENNFIVFTDEETVPEGSDFIASFFERFE